MRRRLNRSSPGGLPERWQWRRSNRGRWGRAIVPEGGEELRLVRKVVERLIDGAGGLFAVDRILQIVGGFARPQITGLAEDGAGGKFRLGIDPEMVIAEAQSETACGRLGDGMAPETAFHEIRSRLG